MEYRSENMSAIGMGKICFIFKCDDILENYDSDRKPYIFYNWAEKTRFPYVESVIFILEIEDSHYHIKKFTIF